jgi:hypothetical protein
MQFDFTHGLMESHDESDVTMDAVSHFTTQQRDRVHGRSQRDKKIKE